jgi:ribokinase
MARLINLGSLCIDHVYRVPNLAGSGETVASTSHQLFPGGKGLNQSLAAARAGVQVSHFGCVGDDGAMLLDVLTAAGVNVDGVRKLPGQVSGHAVIQVNTRGENAIVIAGGTNRAIQQNDVLRALDAVGPGDWLLLQNEINDLPRVLELAGSSSARVAFNLAPVDGRESLYDLSVIDLLIVNEVEAAALTGVGRAEPEKALAVLRDRYPTMTTILTLGGLGLVYCDAGGPISQMDAFAADAVDETAAGDAFIGFCLGGLLQGCSLQQSLRQGSAAGALAVTREGAAASIPTAAEVQRLLSQSSDR